MSTKHLTAVIAALAFAAPAGAQEPTAAPSVEDRLAACLEFVSVGDYPAAEACYREGKRALEADSEANPDDIALFEELAKTSASLAMPATPVRPRPEIEVDLDEDETLELVERGGTPVDVKKPSTLDKFLFGGRTELVLTSTLLGGYLSGLATAEGAFMLQQNGIYINSPIALVPVFLFPLVGGGGALVASGAASVLWKEMSAGDAHLMRAAITMGVANSLGYVGWAMLNSQEEDGIFPNDNNLSPHLAMLGMGAIATAPLLPAVAVSILHDVPEGGPSLGLSAAAWSGAATVLALLAIDQPLQPSTYVASTIAVSNLAFFTGLGLSYVVPVSRAETWAIDIGAAVGGLAAAAMVFGLNAPNPAVGWGGIGAGLAVGGALGLGVAKAVPFAFDAIDADALIQLSPLMTPPARPGDAPAVGLMLSVPNF